MKAIAIDEALTPLGPDGRRWLAENLMLGIDQEVLVRALTSTGYDQRQAEEAADHVRRDPVYLAGSRIGDRLRKTESLLEVYRRLASLIEPPGTIERRSHVTADEFLHAYYARNRPVLLTGMARSWPACTLWTAQYLRDQCGEEIVEVMVGREADDHYEMNSEAHKQLMRFAEYVDTVTATEASNDCYLVANNHFLDSPGSRHLRQDLGVMPDFLDAAQPRGTVFLWFGPRGTVTPLHHDTMNVLLVQILGHKRVTLVPSAQLPLVYNDVAVYSDVDVEEPDGERHPLFAYSDRIELTLQAGDALFIPVGWWHHVRSLDVSISTSFTSFAFPNDYQWQHPGLPR